MAGPARRRVRKLATLERRRLPAVSRRASSKLRAGISAVVVAQVPLPAWLPVDVPPVPPVGALLVWLWPAKTLLARAVLAKMAAGSRVLRG